MEPTGREEADREGMAIREIREPENLPDSTGILEQIYASGDAGLSLTRGSSELGAVLEFPTGAAGSKDFFCFCDWLYQGGSKVILQFPGKNMTDRSGLVKAGREIEEESFRIIDEEMGEHRFPPDQWQIVRRVIHTTGDFDYAQRICFTPGAIGSGIEALRNSACIYADTRMLRAGLSPWRLEWRQNEVVCPAEDAECQELAAKSGVTRTLAAFRRCANSLDGGIVAIGNAPTALQEVIRLIEEEGVRPALVIGVPVGFVQAEESKAALCNVTRQPSITVMGRKGGSSVAVAIVHALMELARSVK